MDVVWVTTFDSVFVCACALVPVCAANVTNTSNESDKSIPEQELTSGKDLPPHSPYLSGIRIICTIDQSRYHIRNVLGKHHSPSNK